MDYFDFRMWKIAVERQKQILMNDFKKDTNANLMNIGVDMTVFMVVIGLVFFPIGYTALKSINKTALGITAGSTEETIVNALATLAIVVLIMAMISQVKGGKKK